MDSTITLDVEALLARIRDLTGLGTSKEAGPVLDATLSALGERLHEQDRRAIAKVLPARFARPLLSGQWPGEFELEELYRRVARAEGVNLGFALEHVQTTCRALGEALPDEVRGMLARALPPSFAALLQPFVADVTPPGHPVAHGALHHSLATGRPGSAHPIAEALPPIAHSHSVVQEDNPHADAKVSSSSGLTQERLDESLAKARPDPHRRISESKD
jgi:uncharacterized protein (DUF2267 family)